MGLRLAGGSFSIWLNRRHKLPTVKKARGSTTTVYAGKYYECTSGACIKHIFAGPKRIASRDSVNTWFYQVDHLGSRNYLTDALGYKKRTTFYYPYGGTRTDTGDADTAKLHYMFTDQESDPETGLYYYGARYYDQAIGRFISADTIVQNYSDPQTLNRYSYVRNNPLLYTDPTGHMYGDEYFDYIDSDFYWESMYSGAEIWGDWSAQSYTWPAYTSDSGTFYLPTDLGGGPAYSLDSYDSSRISSQGLNAQIMPMPSGVPGGFQRSWSMLDYYTALQSRTDTWEKLQSFASLDINALELWVKGEMALESYLVANALVVTGGVTTAGGVAAMVGGYGSIAATGPAGLLIGTTGILVTSAGVGKMAIGVDIYADRFRNALGLPQWFDVVRGFELFPVHR